METQDELDRFIGTLRQHTQYDLSDYSDKSLRRRLHKIMEDEGVSLDALLRRIQRDARYGDRVMQMVTVNTSELFRDPEVWQSLRSSILPRYRNKSQLNVWHVGCSRGQEVYSLMMLLSEMDLLDRAHVYASDINGGMLDLARRGEYAYRFNLSYLDNFDRVLNTNPLNYEAGPSVPYSRYFEIDKEGDRIRMADRLRALPMYRQSNVVACENPFQIKFDIIFCRNVIIYFNRRLQNRVLEMFHENLRPGGALVLGVHELINLPWANRFERVGKVYVRKD